MKTDMLAGIPLFASLEAAERLELSSCLKKRQFAAHEPIFWIGDAGDEFCIVSHGRVLLTIPDPDGKQTDLASLKHGDFFGELSLLDGGPRTATARATESVELLCLKREDFLLFLERNPKATIHIIQVLTRRQRGMLDQLRGIPNPNEVIAAEVNTWTRIADGIAVATARKSFVLVHLAGVVTWISINWALGHHAIDPFPFMLLGMFASLEAIFLSIFVLISQNRQGEKDRIRADLDYQVNVKSHLELMALQQKVDRIGALIDKNWEEDGAAPIDKPDEVFATESTENTEKK